MDLLTLIQAGPTKANDLFARLCGTSGGAVKTRERLFTKLKAQLELHTSLEEQHLGARGGQLAGGGQPGRPAADDHDVAVARQVAHRVIPSPSARASMHSDVGTPSRLTSINA